MKQLSRDEIKILMVSELGLNPELFEFDSSTAVAAALRRVAGFLCPCTHKQLIRAVVDPAIALVENPESFLELVEDVLDAIISLGELVEPQQMVKVDECMRGNILYAIPPSFVIRESGSALILGISTDCPLPLPSELQKHVSFNRHVRRLATGCVDNLHDELIQCGLNELSYKHWLRIPPRKPPEHYLREIDHHLDCAPPSGEIPGLTILDPNKPVSYYRGRWVTNKKHTGRFIGRRKQAYGADLWCYVQLKEGQAEKFVDLPVLLGPQFHTRGCDEAWLLQLAIDVVRGTPQQFKVRDRIQNQAIIECYSPVPKWSQRRWDSIGEPINGRGFLFAYTFNEEELKEEIRFATEELWLKQI